MIPAPGASNLSAFCTGQWGKDSALRGLIAQLGPHPEMLTVALMMMPGNRHQALASSAAEWSPSEFHCWSPPNLPSSACIEPNPTPSLEMDYANKSQVQQTQGLGPNPPSHLCLVPSIQVLSPTLPDSQSASERGLRHTQFAWRYFRVLIALASIYLKP